MDNTRVIYYFYEMYFYIKEIYTKYFTRRSFGFEYDDDTLNIKNDIPNINFTEKQKQVIEDLNSQIQRKQSYINIDRTFEELTNLNPKITKKTDIKVILNFLNKELKYLEEINYTTNLSLSVENIEKNTYLKILIRDLKIIEDIQLLEEKLRNYIKSIKTTEL